MTRKNKLPAEKTLPRDSQPAEETPRLPTEAGQFNQDDLLAEARRALIEEQKEVETKVGVLKKVTGRFKSRKSKEAKLEPKEATEQDNASLQKRFEETTDKKVVSTAVEPSLEAETQAILDALEKAETAVPLELEAAASPISEPVAEGTKAGHPTLSLSSTPSAESGYRDLREVALVGYEEPTAEALAPPRPSINDQIGELAGRVKYQTVKRITISSITAVVCLAVFVVGVFVLKIQPLAPAPSVPTSTIAPTLSPPMPIQVRLPGGWMFALSKGHVTDGKWAPTKAEWLEGTEICRWVSLPWSAQLEAVFQTLKSGDRIDLVMSNYDHWSYRVRSVDEVQVFDLAGLDKNYPSLLLILTNSETDVRFVVLAVP